MKPQCLLLALSLIAPSATVFAHGEDDPPLFKLMIDKLEWRAADGPDPLVWDADAWLGKDLNKLWLKTEGEYRDSATEAASTEVLYSRAVSAYWDLQAGWRRDYSPEADRDWLAVGLKGLAPYWFEVDATLYAGGNGTLFARLDAEYELLLTQRLVLSPELELTAFGTEDPLRGIGAGLSDVELGLRLRYEVRREFAPYIGVNWEKKLGGSADYARDDGEPTDDLQLVVGVRVWF